MSSLPEDPNELFARARTELSPRDEDRSRTYAAVLARAAAAGAVVGGIAAASGEPAATSATAAKTSLLTKLALSVLALVGVTGIVFVAMRENTAPPPAVITTATVAAPASEPAMLVAPSAPIASAAFVPEGTVNVADLPPSKPASFVATARPHPAVNANPPPASAAPTPSDDALARELTLMQRIHAAERAKNALAVLDLVAEHERDFPRGALVEEREASRAVAQCAPVLSDRQRIATSFAQRFPKSPQRARVDAACGR